MSRLPSTPINKTELQVCIQSKIDGYTNSDDKDKQLPVSQQCNLTIEYVEGMLSSCNNKCALCNNTVKLSWETPLDKLQFSIDRINNALGHTVNNVRITCLECNNRNDPAVHIQQTPPSIVPSQIAQQNIATSSINNFIVKYSNYYLSSDSD